MNIQDIIPSTHPSLHIAGDAIDSHTGFAVDRGYLTILADQSADHERTTAILQLPDFNAVGQTIAPNQ